MKYLVIFLSLCLYSCGVYVPQKQVYEIYDQIPGNSFYEITESIPYTKERKVVKEYLKYYRYYKH